MKKIFYGLILLCGMSALGQQVTANLSASSTDCTTAASCVTQALGSNSGAVSITLAGTFSATAQFEASGSNDANYQAISCVPTNSTVTVTSATTTGTWTCNVAGLTNIRVRISSYVSGPVAVTLNRSPASASSRLVSPVSAGSYNVLPKVVSNGAQVGVGAGTTINVTPPASIVDGNLLIAVIEFDGVTGITVSAPSGWTQIATGGSTVAGCSSTCVGFGSVANHKTIQWVFSKIASSESGNYTFTSSAGGESIFFGAITQLTGTITVDAVGTSSGNATNLTVAPFAITNSNDLILIAAHQNGNTYVTIDQPGNYTRQISGNGQVIATVPWGNGNTPNVKIFTTVTNAGTSAASTDDTVMAVLAFSPSATSPSTPLAANSSGSALTQATVNATNGYFSSSVSSPSFYAQGGISGTCTATTAALSTYNNLGVLVPEIAQNNAGALQIDCAQQGPFVTIGNGSHRSTYGLLNSGDQYMFVSQDASQDLLAMSNDSSNNLWVGCNTAACTGGTQQADIKINSQANKLVHIMNNVIDRFTLGDTKSLTSGAAATLLSIPLAADQTTAGTIVWSALATDTVNHLNCATSGETSWSGENSAGVFVVNTSILGTPATACTATKVLGCTFALTGANPALLQATCTLTGITPTSFVMNYDVHNAGGTVPTF